MKKQKDHLFANKIAAAVLVAALLVFGIGYVANAIYHVGEPPEKFGYAIDGGAEIAVASKGADAVIEAIAPLLASASADAGLKVFKKCQTCHTANDGGKNLQGPNLYDIVNADIAGKGGFSYSKALVALEGVWDYEALNAFLLSPRKYAKGTKMGFAGLKKAQDRANVILYLRSLSGKPQALPQ